MSIIAAIHGENQVESTWKINMAKEEPKHLHNILCYVLLRVGLQNVSMCWLIDISKSVWSVVNLRDFERFNISSIDTGTSVIYARRLTSSDGKNKLVFEFSNNNINYTFNQYNST